MVFHLQLFDKKYLLIARFVSYTYWVELAIWKTSRSSLKGWQWLKNFTVVTPLFGAAICFDKRKEQNEGT